MPAEAIQKLVEQYQRFRRDVFPEHRETFEGLADSQNPSVLFITCSDSRIMPDLILQAGPGELFVCRNAGNIVPPYGERGGGVSATIEYAVDALQVQAIIVCGHSDCGAMRALLQPERVQKLPTVAWWLQHAEMARRIVADHYANEPEHSLIDHLVEENVVAQIEHLETHPYVVSRLRRGDLDIYGWVYRIHTGEIVTLDASQGKFVPLDANLASASLPPRRQLP